MNTPQTHRRRSSSNRMLLMMIVPMLISAGGLMGCQPCTEGQNRNDACGLNGRGTQAMICQGGQWGQNGGCVDDDVCVDGWSECGFHYRRG